MNYYYDTEFLEGTQIKRFLGIPVGKTKPTIDLISIGIVSEDDRKYYAISKDFNLKEAWNRYDIKETSYGVKGKEYWIRENVLKPIFHEEVNKINDKINRIGISVNGISDEFTYKNLKRIIKYYGKSNKQIAAEVIEFCKPLYRGYSLEGPDRHKIGSVCLSTEPMRDEYIKKYDLKYFFEKTNPVFHAYYGAYDHVAFCWLFGKMIDLPKGFPMYSVDLKQMLDEKAKLIPVAFDVESGLKSIKFHEDYPKQENAHNALDDARWNKKLHGFIKSQL